MFAGDKTTEPVRIRTLVGNFYMLMMHTMTFVLFHQSALLVDVEIATE